MTTDKKAFLQTKSLFVGFPHNEELLLKKLIYDAYLRLG